MASSRLILNNAPHYYDNLTDKFKPSNHYRFVITHFYNARILRDHTIQNGDLWIVDDKISSPQSRADLKINANQNLIVPGFIDLQLNGGFGIDFTSNPDKIEVVAAKLGQFGVTAFLATVVSSTPNSYRRILSSIRAITRSSEGSELLGIHLEGPFFNTAQSKAHQKEVIRNCTDFSSPAACYGSLENVKLVTLAPELPGALEWIKELSGMGIAVSAGHTMASAEQMKKAMNTGLKAATHLFNAMVPLHHRSPGIIGEVLNSPGFYYSIIADGMHVDPQVVAIAWKCQPEGLFLISDGIAALGNPKGAYILGNRQVEASDKGAYISSSSILAGSIVGMDQQVRNFIRFTGASLVDAMEAASLKPAKMVGLYPQKGCLKVGSDADFLLLDGGLQVLSSYARGKEIYKSNLRP